MSSWSSVCHKSNWRCAWRGMWEHKLSLGCFQMQFVGCRVKHPFSPQCCITPKIHRAIVFWGQASLSVGKRWFLCLWWMGSWCWIFCMSSQPKTCLKTLPKSRGICAELSPLTGNSAISYWCSSSFSGHEFTLASINSIGSWTKFDEIPEYFNDGASWNCG